MKHRGAKLGNKNALGNKGRPSPFKEIIDAQFLADLISGKVKETDVMPRLVKQKRARIIKDPKTGKEKIEHYFEMVPMFRTGLDALAYKLLTGDNAVMNKLLDKLVASKSDVSSGGQALKPAGFIIIPEKEKD